MTSRKGAVPPLRQTDVLHPRLTCQFCSILRSMAVQDRVEINSNSSCYENEPSHPKRYGSGIDWGLLRDPAALYLWFIDMYGVNARLGRPVGRRKYHPSFIFGDPYMGHALDTTQRRKEFLCKPPRCTPCTCDTLQPNRRVYVSAVLLFLTIGLLILTFHRRSPETSWFLYLPVAVLLLSPVQYGNTLWGYQVAWYIVLAALAAVLYFLDRPRLTPIVLGGAIAVAVVGSFSLFQGLLIWPTGLILLYYRRRSITAVLVGSASWNRHNALYFHNFNANENNTSSAGVPFVVHHFASATQFFFTTIGDVVGG